MPSSISFFPELRAFDPAFTPQLNKVFAPMFTPPPPSSLYFRVNCKLPPRCFLLLKFQYYSTILLARSCAAVFFICPGAFLTGLFLIPIVLVRPIVTFDDKFHLLTFLYLAKKDCPLGNRILFGVVHRLHNMFCLTAFLLFSQQKFI